MKNRILDLLAKLLSIKGLCFIVGTVLLILKVNLSYEWLVLCLIIIGDRTLEKFIKKRGP